MTEQKKRHWLFFGFVLLIVLLGIAAYIAVTAIKSVQVNLLEVSLDQVSWTGMRIGFTVRVYNPNPFSITVGRFSANTYANDIFLTAVSLEPFKLPAMQSVDQHFSADVSYAQIGTALLKAIQDKNVNWKVEGEYVLTMPLGITYSNEFRTGR